ncbi:hypothetical protein V6N12_057225 [Hibiscus sabdariffa]|uniref:Uncharacterized protein n=1 Tax=Hibiscus sabdariffa TaxID=183260 RepID=A0ABR2B7T8_9ROSI
MTAALARALGASIGKVVMTDTRLEDESVDSVATSVAASVAPTSSVQAAAITKDAPHDPMVHAEAFDVVEEAVDVTSLDRRLPRQLLIGWLPRISHTIL